MDTEREHAVLGRVPTALYIDGEWRQATGAGTLTVEDPATEQALLEIADAQPEDALAALSAAAETGRVGRMGPARARGDTAPRV